MEQPPKPNSTSSPSLAQSSSNPKKSAINANNKQKIKLPTPKELISHYESQGMGPQEASVKVIDDLQQLLYRVVASGRGKKDKFMAEASRKLDASNARLTILEMKLDSKPGYPETFAIGVASAAAFRGVAAVWPQLATSVAQLWNSVRGVTSSKP